MGKTSEVKIPAYSAPTAKSAVAESNGVAGIPSISLRGLASSVMQQPAKDESSATHNTVQQPLQQENWNEPVTEEQVQKNWIRYARSIEDQNPRLYSMMYNQVPKLKNGIEVWLKLKNATQEVEIQQEKSAIFTFLKRELKNSHLVLKVEMEAEDAQSQRVFTSADKLKMMIEKNPALMNLKQQFGLDLE